MPLFDPADVPEGIIPADKLVLLNELVDSLRARLVENIDIPEPPHGFRIPNMIRAYCQAHLWRCIDLVDAAEALRLSGHGLGTLMMVRATYETVAAFLHFETRLAEAMQPLESDDDLTRVHDFIVGKTFATRKEHLIAQAGENEAIRATNILTQIDAMNKRFGATRSDYDHLCEVAHPNVFGGFIWFGTLENNGQRVSFSAKGPQDADDPLRWSVDGALLLSVFAEAINKIETKLPPLSALSEQLRSGTAGGHNHSEKSG